MAWGAFRASRRCRTFCLARKSFRVCSFIASPRAGVSILRIVTGLLVLLALFALCGWLYFSRRSATGLPAGLLVYDDAGRLHLQRPLVSHCLRLAGRPDYPIETAWSLSSSNPARVPVWTACRSCGPAYDLLRFGRRRVCSSSALRCLAVFRCAAADSVYGGSET